MREACMYTIMELPEETLQRVLPKASTRMIVRLVIFYPRAIGHTLLEILAKTVSPAVIEFIKDEMRNSQTPTYAEVREAEKELAALMYQ
jgi:hypothetical protein